MTLENCKKLLAHYEKLSRGEGIPENHKDKELVIKNAKISAEEMRLRIVAKGGSVDTPKSEKKKAKD